MEPIETCATCAFSVDIYCEGCLHVGECKTRKCKAYVTCKDCDTKDGFANYVNYERSTS